jgi:hypothetical protein
MLTYAEYSWFIPCVDSTKPYNSSTAGSLLPEGVEHEEEL